MCATLQESFKVEIVSNIFQVTEINFTTRLPVSSELSLYHTLNELVTF